MSSQDSSPATLEATWSNWWGSPELLAAFARAMEICLSREVETPVRSSISVWARGYEESFDLQSFSSRISPEFLSRLKRIEASALAGDDCRVTFLLDRESRFNPSTEDGVRLRVQTPEPDVSQAIAEELIPKVAWGYKPYWGPREAPESLDAQPSRAERRLGIVRKVVTSMTSISFGVILYLATASAGIDSILAPLAPVVGILVPTGIEIAVPKVEIATNGVTRMKVILRKVMGSAAAVIGTWVAGLLLGS